MSAAERAAQRKARFVFDAGPAGAWTVDIDEGDVSLARGRGARPTATVFSDPATLVDVLHGRVAGVQAFLEGRLLLRGNIAVTLELDDLLHPEQRDPRSPRCHRVTAAEVDSFYLEAGRRGTPPVVLLHGLGATSSSFLPVMWDLARDHYGSHTPMMAFHSASELLRTLGEGRAAVGVLPMPAEGESAPWWPLCADGRRGRAGSWRSASAGTR